MLGLQEEAVFCFYGLGEGFKYGVHGDYMVSDANILGVKKWPVRVVKSMNKRARSNVQVNEFETKVGIPQDSVLSQLLLQALSRDFRTSVHGSCFM